MVQKPCIDRRVREDQPATRHEFRGQVYQLSQAYHTRGERTTVRRPMKRKMLWRYVMRLS